MINIDQLNTLSRQEFVGTLGGIYEHSPWIAEGVADLRPFGNVAALQTAMKTAVEESAEEVRLNLLRAHPEFAGKAATCGELTEASTQEQGSLSLNKLPPEQHQRMQQLNAGFMEKFGFPGIVAVRKQNSVEDIFNLLESRLQNNLDDEITAAMTQVHLIAECRLLDLVE